VVELAGRQLRWIELPQQHTTRGNVVAESKANSVAAVEKGFDTFVEEINRGPLATRRRRIRPVASEN